MILNKKGLYMIRTFISIWLMSVLAIPFNFGHSSYTYAGESGISQQSIDMLTRMGQAMAEIAEAVKPAIVNISTTRTMKVQERVYPFFNDPFFKKFFGDQFKTPR